jgi:hypothetical protein
MKIISIYSSSINRDYIFNRTLAPMQEHPGTALRIDGTMAGSLPCHQGEAGPLHELEHQNPHASL